MFVLWNDEIITVIYGLCLSHCWHRAACLQLWVPKRGSCRWRCSAKVVSVIWTFAISHLLLRDWDKFTKQKKPNNFTGFAQLPLRTIHSLNYFVDGSISHITTVIQGVATAAGHVIVLATVGFCHMGQDLTALSDRDDLWELLCQHTLWFYEVIGCPVPEDAGGILTASCHLPLAHSRRVRRGSTQQQCPPQSSCGSSCAARLCDMCDIFSQGEGVSLYTSALFLLNRSSVRLFIFS